MWQDTKISDYCLLTTPIVSRSLVMQVGASLCWRVKGEPRFWQMIEHCAMYSQSATGRTTRLKEPLLPELVGLVHCSKSLAVAR
jgi:hypothetical protein